MSSVPQTIDEAVVWFERTHDPVMLRSLLVTMTTKPDYISKKCMSVPQAWNRIHDMGYLYNDPLYGWIDRAGKVYSCNYAAHDTLLYWLETTPQEVEQAGWVRFTRTGFQCLFRVSKQQKQALETIGLAVDSGDERLKNKLEKK